MSYGCIDTRSWCNNKGSSMRISRIVNALEWLVDVKVTAAIHSRHTRNSARIGGWPVFGKCRNLTSRLELKLRMLERILIDHRAYESSDMGPG